MIATIYIAAAITSGLLMFTAHGAFNPRDKMTTRDKATYLSLAAFWPALLIIMLVLIGQEFVKGTAP